MAGETLITVVGNLTDDPELRFTPSGAAVANFTVASTPRTLNKQTNEWEDGEAMFLRCSIWRQAAENVAESLQKGARVIVQGRMRARTWETREGEKRTSFEIDVDEIGPSLRWATAKVARVSRAGGGGGYRRRWRPGRRSGRWRRAGPVGHSGSQPVRASQRRPGRLTLGWRRSGRRPVGRSRRGLRRAPVLILGLSEVEEARQRRHETISSIQPDQARPTSPPHSGPVTTQRRASREEAPQWPRQ